MRNTLILLTLAAIGIFAFFPCENSAPAQITLTNSATGGPPSATTTGSQHSYDKVNFMVGASSCKRTPATNTDHLPTLAALDPTSVGNGGASAAPGFTIQWWYKPVAPTAFAYHWSDRGWGSFRCFQNGAAGVGEVVIRGPLVDCKTTGSVLVNSTSPTGWIHLAVTVDTKANLTTWYVNGKLNNTSVPNITGKGTAFVCLGDTGSSSGYEGNADDFRIYNWARTAADVAADYTKMATGNGPSGSPNVPDLGYYMCELPGYTCKAPATLSLGTSGPVDLSNGPATDFFQIAASLGNKTVLNLGPCSVKLDVDAVLLYSIMYGAPIFNGYRGTLVAGTGTGKFSPPVIAALVGLDVYHAAVAYGKAGITACSNTVKTNLTK